MSYGILESQDFDRYLTISEKARHDEAVASNDAFVLAMVRAVKRGRENAKRGTFVDHTPPISALKLRGTIPMSACGSPAQMCMEIGGQPGGTESMKA